LICVMYSISVLTVVQHNSDSIQSMYNRDGKSGSVVFWYHYQKSGTITRNERRYVAF